ncbi:NADH-quinone oxidoreductase subunit A, partial [Streptomyces javensis]|nr:NADH-quinone oxidoreductase subunit A [Streptomyces javensis]
CGFISIFGQTRSNFQIHFFLVALLFLVFDLEIILIMPVGVTLYDIGNFGFSIFVIFFLILTVGFVLEIGSGAIKFTSDKNTVQTPSIKLLKLNNIAHNLKINKPLVHLSSHNIKFGTRYFSSGPNTT